MIVSTPQNAIHKQWMLRVLSEIADDSELANNTAFKGGSCATLLGYLDRFSVDLDFDLLNNSKIQQYRNRLHKIFEKLDLIIDDESNTQLQFFLKYKSKPNERNTLKLEIIDTGIKNNTYENNYLSDIDRYLQCQTIETMFANKLVALIDRYEQHGSIAARDVYDINHFFIQGYPLRHQVIEERRGVSAKQYLQELREFIEDKITQKVITEDLNYLLAPKQFQLARKNLKTEVLANIRTEIESLEG